MKRWEITVTFEAESAVGVAVANFIGHGIFCVPGLRKTGMTSQCTDLVGPEGDMAMPPPAPPDRPDSSYSENRRRRI